MLEQTLKGQYRRALIPGLFSSRKRVMSVKGTECSKLCGVMYVKPSVVHMKGDKGLVYTQCMLAKR